MIVNLEGKLLFNYIRGCLHRNIKPHSSQYKHLTYNFNFNNIISGCCSLWFIGSVSFASWCCRLKSNERRWNPWSKRLCWFFNRLLLTEKTFICFLILSITPLRHYCFLYVENNQKKETCRVCSPTSFYIRTFNKNKYKAWKFRLYYPWLHFVKCKKSM